MSKRQFVDLIKARIEDEGSGNYHYTGLWNDQVNREADEDPIRYPAVFLEFSSLEWSPMAGKYLGIQKATVELTLRICFKTIKRDDSPEIDILDNLYKILQGWSSDIHNAMNRISEEQDTDYNNVMVWSQTYAFNLLDATAVDKNYQEWDPPAEWLNVNDESEIIVEDQDGDIRSSTKEHFEDEIGL